MMCYVPLSVIAALLATPVQAATYDLTIDKSLVNITGETHGGQQWQAF